MADQPAAQDPDALPPELQAAVEAARTAQKPSWTDFPPEALEGLTAHASADPAWDEEAERAKPDPVTEEEIDRALEQWQEALSALFVLRLRSGR